jgi:hypothetical protein
MCAEGILNTEEKGCLKELIQKGDAKLDQAFEQYEREQDANLLIGTLPGRLTLARPRCSRSCVCRRDPCPLFDIKNVLLKVVARRPPRSPPVLGPCHGVVQWGACVPRCCRRCCSRSAPGAAVEGLQRRSTKG